MAEDQKVPPETLEKIQQISAALMGTLTPFIGQPVSEETAKRMAAELCAAATLRGCQASVLSVEPATWENLHPVWWKRAGYRCLYRAYRLFRKRPRFSYPTPGMFLINTSVGLPVEIAEHVEISFEVR